MATNTHIPNQDQIVAWFSGLSSVNQLAAGLNPRAWAEAQATGEKAGMADELERRARVWREYLRALAEED